MLDALAPGGAWFFRQLSDAVGSHRRPGAAAPRCGSWSGPAGSATTPSPRSGRSPAPARPSHRTRRPPPRPGRRRPHRPARDRRPLGAAAARSTPTRPAARTPPPSDCSTGTASSPAARWSASGCRAGSRRSTRCSSAFEDSGRCRRGYFVERPRRRPVRHRRARSTGCAPSAETPGRREAAGAIALAATDPANPYGAALPWPDRRAAATGRAARPARWSCSSTACSRSTSSAAAAPCSPGATTPTCSTPRPRRSPRRSGAARSAGSPSRRPTAHQLLGGGPTPLREALDAAGFVATPRGLRMRECLRVTPSTGPRAGSTAPSPGRSLTGTDFRVPSARDRRPHRRAASSRPSPAASTCSPGSRARQALTLHTHLKMEGVLARLRARGALAAARPPGPGRARDRRPDQAVGFSLGIVELLPTSRGAERRRPPRARPARPGLGRGRGAAPAAARTPTDRWARRCSTRRVSPASATCTPPSSASSSGAAPTDAGRRRCPTWRGSSGGPSRCSSRTSPGPPRPRPATCASRSGSTGATKAPCRRCGTPIEVAMRGEPGRERASYWCPRCQAVRLRRRTRRPRRR